MITVSLKNKNAKYTNGSTTTTKALLGLMIEELVCDSLRTIVKLRFCEKDTKLIQNHHLRFVLCRDGRIYGGDFVAISEYMNFKHM